MHRSRICEEFQTAEGRYVISMCLEENGRPRAIDADWRHRYVPTATHGEQLLDFDSRPLEMDEKAVARIEEFAGLPKNTLMVLTIKAVCHMLMWPTSMRDRPEIKEFIAALVNPIEDVELPVKPARPPVPIAAGKVAGMLGQGVVDAPFGW